MHHATTVGRPSDSWLRPQPAQPTHPLLKCQLDLRVRVKSANSQVGCLKKVYNFGHRITSLTWMEKKIQNGISREEITVCDRGDGGNCKAKDKHTSLIQTASQVRSEPHSKTKRIAPVAL